MTDPLRAPFPWFGGKSRVAIEVWERFGDVANYLEPFAGSLAVLLARPHAPRIETVNDLDAHLCNFWRTMAAIGAGDEQALRDVCAVADWPVNETDLHARHRWLVARIPETRALLDSDPGAFDATLAGYWVWGICAWIGSGWCTDRNPGASKLPSLGGMRSGDAATGGDGSKGIHAKAMRGQLPNIGSKAPSGRTQEATGIGVNALGARSRLPEVFAALGARLRYVRVACGDWRRVLTDSVTWRHGTTGIFLDPPYPEGEQGMYAAGDAKAERHVWHDVAEWAAEHGEDKRLRIALCGYEGTWSAPPGWSVVAWKARGGYAGQGDGEKGFV